MKISDKSYNNIFTWSRSFSDCGEALKKCSKEDIEKNLKKSYLKRSTSFVSEKFLRFAELENSEYNIVKKFCLVLRIFIFIKLIFKVPLTFFSGFSSLIFKNFEKKQIKDCEETNNICVEENIKINQPEELGAFIKKIEIQVDDLDKRWETLLEKQQQSNKNMDDGAGDYYLSTDEEDDSSSDSDFEIWHTKRSTSKQNHQNKHASKIKLLHNLKQQKSDGNIGRSEISTNEIKTIQKHRRLVRCNSTSTIKIQSTMQKPNHDATIEVIAHELYKIIESSDKLPKGGISTHAFGQSFDLAEFNDPLYTSISMDYSDSDYEEDNDDDDELVLVEEEKIDENFNPNYHNKTKDNLQMKPSSKLRNENSITEQISKKAQPLSEYSQKERANLVIKSKIQCKKNISNLPVPPVVRPTPATIREYLKKMFSTAECAEDCNIICLIYLRRMLECAGNPYGLTSYNWKVCMMTALLLASKVWDDLSMVNEDFAYFLPFSLEQINSWEVKFLSCIKFNVRVSASEYAKVYFDLRKRAQREGYDYMPEKELDIHQAVKLEALSSSMQNRTKQMHHYASAPARYSTSPMPNNSTNSNNNPCRSSSDSSHTSVNNNDLDQTTPIRRLSFSPQKLERTQSDYVCRKFTRLIID